MTSANVPSGLTPVSTHCRFQHAPFGFSQVMGLPELFASVAPSLPYLTVGALPLESSVRVDTHGLPMIAHLAAKATLTET